MAQGRAQPEVGLLERLRGVHQEMMGAVLGGRGLEQVAELAALALGDAVAIVVPRHDVAVAAPSASSAVALASLRPYVADRLRQRPVRPPTGLRAEVPVASGGELLGIVALVAGDPSTPAAPADEAQEFLHLAAVAALTRRAGARRGRADGARVVPRGRPRRSRARARPDRPACPPPGLRPDAGRHGAVRGAHRAAP